MSLAWEDKSWFDWYQRALLEIDTELLAARIQSAEAAIYERVQELGYSEGDHQELIALNNALNVLRKLAEHGHLRK